MQIIGKMTLSGTMTLNPPPCIPYPPIMGNVSYSINNTGNANTFANVTFTPQYDGGAGVLCYSVVSNTGVVANALTTTITVNGLTKGNTYTFTAYATNGQGRSTSSNTSIAVTPVTVPGAPSIISANIISCSANVFFTGPSDSGGNTIFTYTAVSSPGCISANSTTSPILVGGLSSCSNYTFSVKALNSVGASASSGISNSISTSSAPGQLWGWGLAACGGLLAQGNSTNYSSPKQVGSLSNWQSISEGSYYALAIKSNGTLWGWGLNQYGQLGNCSSTGSSSPVQIGALTNWKTVSANEYTNTAIKTDGTMWSWGQNYYGSLGLNFTNGTRSSPTQIGSCTNWKGVQRGTCGATVALKTDGTLWSWGKAYYGNLGNNCNSINQSSPVQIGALTTWASVSTINSSMQMGAIKSDGTLWTWGGPNNSGQLGLCVTTYSFSSPKQVGSQTYWKQLAIGNNSGAIDTSGRLWTWGGNYNGALGLLTQGSGTYKSSPTQVGALTNWKKIITGGFANSIALKRDGTIWAWGYGGCGLLGQNTNTSYSSPKQVGSATTWSNIGLGTRATFGIRT